MISIKRLSGTECVRALRRAGFDVKLVSDKGTALSREGRVVLVPPDPALTISTLRWILTAAHMSWEELFALVEPAPFSPKASGIRARVTAVDDPVFSRPYAPQTKRR